ncbi:TlpA disulfide reductase family protein [Lutimonas halocynthiae]|uniref:TlpA family protein disulfide reductase n=1 Tax=Lutimonas halocynthiae TaxID=1446477 RepID=UPI0025B50EF1|nr:TlpA disulfide reductase family protein [Lutimonas halocynthiae]MDN3644141.1 TlpA disulfide reductase family protein [Lutimonas halocynthiae]
MKKVIMLLVAISLFACSEESNKTYVTLQGNINNSDLDSILILGKDFKKTIQVNEDGSFKDTLKVVDGFHGITDGKKQGFLYLKNGYDMEVEIDMEKFPESVVYEGQGSITNNYLVKKIQFIKDEKLTDYAAFFSLEKDEFDSKLIALRTRLDDMLNSTEGLDEEVIKIEKESTDKLINFFESNYENEHANYVGLNVGDPSPKFNYPDQNGNNVSLDDLKGKYVYVDVWATWCGPCKKEIPFLKEMDEAYKGKNIAFVSLSIDKMEHKDKWLKMIKDEDLGGIQILADQDWNSEFVTAYNIKGIPRFILIDKEGNIVNSNAPRPSDPNLKEVLSTLAL